MVVYKTFFFFRTASVPGGCNGICYRVFETAKYTRVLLLTLANHVFRRKSRNRTSGAQRRTGSPKAQIRPAAHIVTLQEDRLSVLFPHALDGGSILVPRRPPFHVQKSSVVPDAACCSRSRCAVCARDRLEPVVEPDERPVAAIEAKHLQKKHAADQATVGCFPDTKRTLTSWFVTAGLVHRTAPRSGCPKPTHLHRRSCTPGAAGERTRIRGRAGRSPQNG